jgi:TPR repeat protein
MPHYTPLVEENYELYRSLLLRFKGSHIRALVLLAAFYMDGKESLQVIKNKGKAFQLCTAAADIEEGSNIDRCEAKVALAMYYGSGTGVGIDKKKCRELLEGAAAIFSPDALFEEGCKFRVEGKEEESARYFSIAAQLGHSKAQVEAGVVEHNVALTGDPESSDDFRRESFINFERAFEDRRDTSAAFNLGVCYMKGSGVFKDEKEAIRYFKFAADAGHVEAQFRMGYFLEVGRGIPKNEKRAFELYELAADAGHVNAKYRAGLCYDSGTGVEQDKGLAHACYVEACAAGDEYAAKKLASAKGGAASSGDSASPETTSVGGSASSSTAPSTAARSATAGAGGGKPPSKGGGR